MNDQEWSGTVRNGQLSVLKGPETVKNVDTNDYEHWMPQNVRGIMILVRIVENVKNERNAVFYKIPEDPAFCTGGRLIFKCIYLCILVFNNLV